jgi:outer membrane protein assembly factor BamB
LWARSVGPLVNQYGHASSLEMGPGLLYVLLDQGSSSKPRSVLLALDAATGKTVWEAKRPVPASWATPILINTGKSSQLITCAAPWVIAYDPGKGVELWRVNALSGDVAPSPVFGGGMVLAVNAGAQLAAIRPDGCGDVTKTAVVWSASDGLPDICSPLTDGSRVWLLTMDGRLTCYGVKDGAKTYEVELDSIFQASPSLAGDLPAGAGRLYVTDLKGVTRILAPADGKELAKADVGEKVTSCPAFMDGRIYIRGEKHLFAIGNR